MLAIALVLSVVTNLLLLMTNQIMRRRMHARLTEFTDRTAQPSALIMFPRDISEEELEVIKARFIAQVGHGIFAYPVPPPPRVTLRYDSAAEMNDDEEPQ